MGIITKLFGRNGGDPPPPPRDVAALVAPICRSAVRLVKSAGESRSYLGGTPPLAAGTAWPTKGADALTFLACLDLESLREVSVLPWLPPSGRLLFFYDTENQPWGFDPKHRGGWAVLHTADASTAATRQPPTPALPRIGVSFESVRSVPSWERPEVSALQMTDAEADTLVDLQSAVYRKEPCHQVDGFPNPIQGDEMELECQLVSHGIYCGDASGYESAKAAALRGGASEWKLLLQVDSDDDLKVMWGDGGVLYFWIREGDARAGRFENAWVVLQCF
jgi:uncharacterized protein YwqG